MSEQEPAPIQELPLEQQVPEPPVDTITPPAENLARPVELDVLGDPGVTQEAQVQEMKKSGFFKARFEQLKNWYEGLTEKQTDALQVGAFVLAATIFPATGTLEHIPASEHLLQAEGLLGFGALEVATFYKVRNAFKNGFGK